MINIKIDLYNEGDMKIIAFVVLINLKLNQFAGQKNLDIHGIYIIKEKKKKNFFLFKSKFTYILKKKYILYIFKYLYVYSCKNKDTKVSSTDQSGTW